MNQEQLHVACACCGTKLIDEGWYYTGGLVTCFECHEAGTPAHRNAEGTCYDCHECASCGHIPCPNCLEGRIDGVIPAPATSTIDELRERYRA